jgi:hypothetical protein
MINKILLFNNLYNKDNCCRGCRRYVKVYDKLTCYIKFLKKYFKLYFPNYILTLIGDQENIFTDLISNGIQLGDKSIFIHFNKNNLTRKFKKNFLNNRNITDYYVNLYDKLPNNIKEILLYVNKYIPNNGNNNSKGNFTIKINKKIKKLNINIPDNLGIHRIGLVKKSTLSVLNSVGYGKTNGNDLLWSLDGINIPVYTTLTISSFKMKLILLASYLRGNVLFRLQNNADLENTLNNIFVNTNSISSSISLLLSINYSSLSVALSYLFLFILNSNLTEVIEDYSSYESYQTSGFFGTTNYYLEPNLDEYGNLDLSNNYSLYFDLSGNKSFDVVFLNNVIIDNSGNMGIFDNSGNEIKISNFNNNISSTSYDLSNNIFTYNLKPGIVDNSGNPTTDLSGYKMFDSDNNPYDNSVYMESTTVDSSRSVVLQLKQGFDSSGNSLLSFFDLYTLSTTDSNSIDVNNLGIDYTEVENEFNTINNNFETIINNLINFESSFMDAYSNNLLVVLYMIRGINENEIESFIPSETLYNILKDNNQITDISYNFNYSYNGSGINQYYYVSFDNIVNVYNFFTYAIPAFLVKDVSGSGYTSPHTLLDSFIQNSNTGNVTVDTEGLASYDEDITSTIITISITVALLIIAVVTAGVAAGLAGAAAVAFGVTDIVESITIINNVAQTTEEIANAASKVTSALVKITGNVISEISTIESYIGFANEVNNFQDLENIYTLN